MNGMDWLAERLREIEQRPIRIPAQFRAHDNGGTYIDTSKAKYAQSKRLRHRLLADGERTYAAYSANELLEIESQADRARPGHFFG